MKWRICLSGDVVSLTAELLTEFALWRRAGLDSYDPEGADQSTAEYRRRTKAYARLRNGPEYITELQHIQAGEARHAAVQARQRN